MKRCDPNVRAKCPDGQHCELYAAFTDGSLCDQFNEQALNQPVTNADRIRAMSDEELAALLIRDLCDEVFCVEANCKWAECPDDCTDAALRWLRQPAG